MFYEKAKRNFYLPCSISAHARNVKEGTNRVKNHDGTLLLLLLSHLVVIWKSVNDAF